MGGYWRSLAATHRPFLFQSRRAKRDEHEAAAMPIEGKPVTFLESRAQTGTGTGQRLSNGASNGEFNSPIAKSCQMRASVGEAAQKTGIDDLQLDRLEKTRNRRSPSSNWSYWTDSGTGL
ncbi:hypothetical protein EG329_002214 [Mollisiaceae sp. DMI_Dod_QoI]|nr:hypothetical protein EG329_002214 [Helotiales sp. DMI_Dod_QoI]